MNFILRNWVKYYTKEAMKTLKLLTIGSAIVVTVVCIKYRPAYKVTVSGETIGYVEDRNLIENKIKKYMDCTEGNIAFREIAVLPEYEFKLVNREKDVNNQNVMLAIENLTTTTYRFYAVTSDGEQKTIVKTQDEAESIINEIKSDLKKDVDLKLGIVEVFKTDVNEVSSKETATNTLNELKIAKVTEYEKQKAEEAKKRAARAAAIKTKSVTTMATAAPTGNLNGLALAIPVNGTVSSRFGSRGSSRSSSHTGVDICTSSGTGIRPVATGTVVYAGYKGSYGNLVIIDHGNGVQSYYAHCSALYVSAGQQVTPGTIIAAVGSTGNSTGPHLHLRIGGVPVNPQNYLY